MKKKATDNNSFSDQSQDVFSGNLTEEKNSDASPGNDISSEEEKSSGPIETDSHNTGDSSSNGELSSEMILKKKEEALDALKKERDSLKDLLQRRQADFENFKKRSTKLQESFKKTIIKDFAFDIIQINDDLIRAIEASSKIEFNKSCDETHDSFVQGVSIISRRIEETLGKYGVTEIEAEGQEFDPNYHEAVEIESNEDVNIDTVTWVYQKGFKIDDLIVRSAKVRVAKPTPQGSGE